MTDEPKITELPPEQESNFKHVDDEFEKALHARARALLSQRIKYSVDRMVEASNPTLMTSFDEDSFSDGAAWGRQYALEHDINVKQLIETLETASAEISVYSVTAYGHYRHALPSLVEIRQAITKFDELVKRVGENK